MGNWQLEVAKMALYVTFPVALFHYFNQPEYFEEWVKTTKNRIYPHNMASESEKMREAITEIRRKQELQYLKELEEQANQ